jgi:soluble lytic murein transglycosylase-like protein
MRKLVVLLLVVGAVGVAALSTGQWVIDNVRYRGLIGPMVVPAEYRDVLIAAAERCPRIPVEVLAAQIAAESRWDTAAVSPAGAQGIAQFMPKTWEKYGIDADGDGVADIWNPVDAIHSAAALNCVNRRLVRGLPGDRLHNTLAAYNAGPGAVRQHGGVPPFNETRGYVARIMRNAERIVVQPVISPTP